LTELSIYELPNKSSLLVLLSLLRSVAGQSSLALSNATAPSGGTVSLNSSIFAPGKSQQRFNGLFSILRERSGLTAIRTTLTAAGRHGPAQLSHGIYLLAVGMSPSTIANGVAATVFRDVWPGEYSNSHHLLQGNRAATMEPRLLSPGAAVS